MIHIIKQTSVIVRSFLVWSLLAPSAAALADALTSFPYGGLAYTDQITLENDAMKPVFKDVVIPRTCYRQERCGSHQECRIFYRNECHVEHRRVCDPHGCHDVPQTVCRSRPERVCTTVDDYRPVPYDCSTTERRQVGEEVDYHVSTKTQVRVSPVESSVPLQARLSLNLKGPKLSAAVVSQNARILYVGQPQVVSMQETQKLKTYSYDLILKALNMDLLTAPMNGPMSIVPTSDGHEVTFYVSKVIYPEQTALRFALVRLGPPGALSDHVLVSKPLVAGEYEMTDLDATRSQIRVHLDRFRMNETLANGTYETSLLIRIPLEDLRAQGVVNPELLNTNTSQYTSGNVDVRF